MGTSGSYKIVKLFLQYQMADKKMSQEALHKRQEKRGALTEAFYLAKRPTEKDLEARKHYWYQQIRSLKDLLEAQHKSPPPFDFKEKLNYYLDTPTGIKELLYLIKKDYAKQSIAQPPRSAQKEPEPKKNSTDNIVQEGNVLNVIKSAIENGYIPVVNNASNSKTDGVSKLFHGSLEELLARHTNSLLTMPCHFHDMDAKHAKQPEDLVLVEMFQCRYLRACLTTMRDIVNHKDPDEYMSSREFIEKFLRAEDHIFFALQNRAYEVNSETGFVSHAKYRIKDCNSLTEALDSKTQDETADVRIIHATAPDRRNYFESVYDRECTQDKYIRNPSSTEALQKMITGGINTQCDEALKLAKEYKEGLAKGKKGLKPPQVIFLLPGCGAFGNPPKKTAKIFVAAIKARQDELNKEGVPFTIVEYNSSIAKELRKAWNTTPAIQKKANYNYKGLFKTALHFVVRSFYLRRMNQQIKKTLKAHPELPEAKPSAQSKIKGRRRSSANEIELTSLSSGRKKSH